MRMIVGVIILALLTIHFGVAYGGSKKSPNIPRRREINRGETAKDDSEDKIPRNGNSIDGNSIDDTSRHLNASPASNETKVKSMFGRTVNVNILQAYDEEGPKSLVTPPTAHTDQ